MRRASPGLLTFALLAVGGLAVHQLRYLLGYGAHAEEALAMQGHAYLTLAGPLVALALAAGFARLLVVALGAAREPANPGGPSFTRAWAAAALALAAIYVSQELLEGLLAAGHPTGLAGVLDAGGWTALPLAAAFGALVASVLRGAHAVVRLVRGTPRRWSAPDLDWTVPAQSALRRPLEVQARHLAARGPPARL